MDQTSQGLLQILDFTMLFTFTKHLTFLLIAFLIILVESIPIIHLEEHPMVIQANFIQINLRCLVVASLQIADKLSLKESLNCIL